MLALSEYVVKTALNAFFAQLDTADRTHGVVVAVRRGFVRI